MENTEILRKIFLFKGFTSFELIKINRIIRNRKVVKGELIIEENSSGNSIYVVKNGSVRITKMLKNKQSRTLTTLVDFDFFGEMSFIDDYPRSATVVASTNGELIEIDGNELKKILKKDLNLASKLYSNLTQILCKRLRLANENLIVMKYAEEKD
jgi:CRP-like cAMP-binding protein